MIAFCLLLMLSAPAAAFASSTPRSEVQSPHGSFSEPCATCHAATGWEEAVVSESFDHARYGFELSGAHAGADCMFCHSSLDFEKVDSDCSACHQDVHQGEFGSDCSVCHGTRSFIDRAEQVSAHRETRFPLSGAHATLDCQQCHQSNAGGAQFVNTPTECYACHESDYASTSAPNHARANFGTDCTQCHNMVTFAGAGYGGSHDFFPLRGGHAGLDCLQCHTSGEFSALDNRCVACHQSDYEGTTDPAHAAAGFSVECEACHNINTWAGSTFDHGTTAFPLTGAHRSTECAQCHVSGVYAGTRSDCYSCHQNDYTTAADPNHETAGFPTDCEDCHSTASWAGATFDHGATAFPLTGAHRSVECAQCHVGGQFTGTRSDCYSCHQNDYTTAADPNHVTANFPTECDACHGTATWSGATFDHDASGFPLTGSHRAVACNECHIGGQFSGTRSECNACHAAEFDATTDPPHMQAGFPRTCDVCHGTIAWIPGQFDHGATAFPLTGSHVAVECTACHVGGVYAGTQSDCYACHRNDYDTTTNPAHGPAGFGTDCAACHSTTGWAGANFDHNQWFPINSGKHRGKWNDCQDCHTNPANYAVYNCLGCHPHSDRSKTDEKHREEQGYRYDSVACYDCHPRGRSE